MPLPDVEFEQIHEGTRESGQVGKTQIAKVFEVDWSDRQQFVAEAFGYTEEVDGLYIRTMPWACPDWPSLYPFSWEIVPIGRSSEGENTGEYEKAHVTIIWSEPEFHGSETEAVTPPGEDPSPSDPESVVLYSIQVTDNSTYESLPTSNIKWNSDNKPLNKTIARVANETVFELILHRVTYLPVAEFSQMVGRCNEQAFTLGIIDASPGTLQFQNWRTEPRQTTFSIAGLLIPTWTVVLKLALRPDGWNVFPRPDTGAYDAIIPEDGVINFSPINFNFLKKLRTG